MAYKLEPTTTTLQTINGRSTDAKRPEQQAHAPTIRNGTLDASTDNQL